jgi:NAD(P)-dependent dehydrogenase (short-subunit alcohol dehydrogenase family)
MSSQLESEAAFESGIAGFVYRQWFLHRKPVPTGTKLTNQTAIVTGSNVGLGLEAARQLLQLGLANLIMAVRSQQKGDEAAKGLRAEFPDAQIQVWILDMEDYQSIGAFVNKCKALDRIDIVLLNAGIQNSTFKLTPSTRHEQSFQVNYISTALLSILLLPVLKAKKQAPPAKPPMLCLVTSDTAYWAKIENKGPIMAKFDEEASFSEFSWYMNSKLAQQLFVARIAEEVSADDVTINMVSPGLCSGTAIGRGSPPGMAYSLFMRLLARTVEVGASTYVDAVVVQGKESHGSLTMDWSLRP